MRRTFSAISVAALSLGLIATAPPVAKAVWTDADLCPGTGLECVVSHPITVTASDGIVDITNPGPGIPPLVLHIKSGGVLAAAPSTPLTIKAGGLIIDKGGVLSGVVAAGNGNTINVTTICNNSIPGHPVCGFVTIAGKIDVSAAASNNAGGSGGSISVTTPPVCTVVEGTVACPCEIDGAVLANAKFTGQAPGPIGNDGGAISLQCGHINVAGTGLIEASASGFIAAGGNISLTTVNPGDTLDHGLTLAKSSTVRALGVALDGGTISLSTDPAFTDNCSIAGKLIVDANNMAPPGGGPKIGGSGGSIDIGCGGSVTLESLSALKLSGDEGGGAASINSGTDMTMASIASIKANGGSASGGSVDIAAGGNATAAGITSGDVTISGKIEARAGGTAANDTGEISVTATFFPNSPSDPLKGNLSITGKTAILNVSAAHKDQQTGQITLAGGLSVGSASPVLNIDAGTVLKLDGYTAGLGGFDVDISGSSCILGGKIKADAKAQNGAAIGFTCDNVTFAPGSALQAKSTAAASVPTGSVGGTLAVDTSGTSGGTPGPCQFGGKIELKGMSTNFPNPIDPTHPLTAVGHGGNMTANCGAGISVPGTGVINVSALGGFSAAGGVGLSAAGNTHIQGAINATAKGALSGGGTIAITAPDLTFDAAPGAVDVSSAGQSSTAGSIQLSSTSGGSAKIWVGKTLSAKGNGGSVLISGCTLDVDQKGWLSADGSNGSNWIRIKHLTISGKVTATNGLNHFSIAPIGSGTVKPLPKFDVFSPVCP